MGYAHYSDGDESKGGFGTKWGIGVEYQLNKTVGIGIGIRHYVATFSKEENPYYDSDKYTNGFKRLALNAGLRIYL
jgi:opacity protein-like surface antigen